MNQQLEEYQSMRGYKIWSLCSCIDESSSGFIITAINENTISVRVLSFVSDKSARKRIEMERGMEEGVFKLFQSTISIKVRLSIRVMFIHPISLLFYFVSIYQQTKSNLFF